MKTNWTNLLLTAVGMTLSAAAAYGQELNANIPFAFQTTHANPGAGKYEVCVIGEGALMIVQVANLDSGKSILASAYRGSEKPGPARLVFRCWDTRGCSLAEAYDGSGSAWPPLSAAAFPQSARV